MSRCARLPLCFSLTSFTVLLCLHVTQTDDGVQLSSVMSVHVSDLVEATFGFEFLPRVSHLIKLRVIKV